MIYMRMPAKVLLIRETIKFGSVQICYVTKTGPNCIAPFDDVEKADGSLHQAREHGLGRYVDARC